MRVQARNKETTDHFCDQIPGQVFYCTKVIVEAVGPLQRDEKEKQQQKVVSKFYS